MENFTHHGAFRYYPIFVCILNGFLRFVSTTSVVIKPYLEDDKKSGIQLNYVLRNNIILTTYRNKHNILCGKIIDFDSLAFNNEKTRTINDS